MNIVPASIPVLRWAAERAHLSDTALESYFRKWAIFYRIAHALADRYVVATHVVAANSPKRIKIPNVCIGLGLRFMTPYEMLRREQARFILGSYE